MGSLNRFLGIWMDMGIFLTQTGFFQPGLVDYGHERVTIHAFTICYLHIWLISTPLHLACWEQLGQRCGEIGDIVGY